MNFQKNQSILLSGFADEIDISFDRQLQALEEFNVRFIELRNVDGVNVADLTDEKLSEIRSKLDARKIAVSSIGSPIGKISVTDDFAPHFGRFRRIVEIAKALGTSNIRVFSFYIPKGENPEACRGEVIARMRELTDYASGAGVTLLHENEKGIYGDTVARCEDLMQTLYCNSFKAVFDFANFVECGENTLEAYERLKPYIAYIHIKDATAGEHRIVPAGEGDGQLAAILVKLKEAGYRGFLSLEPHLVDFAGLQSLEQEAKKRGSGMDGKTAWRLALYALKSILWDIDWR